MISFRFLVLLQIVLFCFAFENHGFPVLFFFNRLLRLQLFLLLLGGGGF